MIRQAHTYLVGAMGGATLIAIAIVVFAVLVSAQVFKDWPIAALGGHGDEAAVSSGQPAAGGKAVEVSAVTGTAARANGAATKRPRHRADSARTPGSLAAGGSVGAPRAGEAPTQTGGSEGGSGGQQGSSPAASAPQTSPAPSGSSGTSSSGGGGKAGTGGNGSAANGITSSPTTQVTETVNDTVSKVDEGALGGTLGATGATGVTEGVVNGVVGPESTVGKVVDETVGAVGGLLGGKR